MASQHTYNKNRTAAKAHRAHHPPTAPPRLTLPHTVSHSGLLSIPPANTLLPPHSGPGTCCSPFLDYTTVPVGPGLKVPRPENSLSPRQTGVVGHPDRLAGCFLSLRSQLRCPSSGGPISSQTKAVPTSTRPALYQCPV